jgi:hypothetical protein
MIVYFGEQGAMGVGAEPSRGSETVATHRPGVPDDGGVPGQVERQGLFADLPVQADAAHGLRDGGRVGPGALQVHAAGPLGEAEECGDAALGGGGGAEVPAEEAEGALPGGEPGAVGAVAAEGDGVAAGDGFGVPEGGGVDAAVAGVVLAADVGHGVLLWRGLAAGVAVQGDSRTRKGPPSTADGVDTPGGT